MKTVFALFTLVKFEGFCLQKVVDSKEKALAYFKANCPDHLDFLIKMNMFDDNALFYKLVESGNVREMELE